jgi:hypothetical protein
MDRKAQTGNTGVAIPERIEELSRPRLAVDE